MFLKQIILRQTHHFCIFLYTLFKKNDLGIAVAIVANGITIN